MQWVARKVFVSSADDIDSVLLSDVDPLFSAFEGRDHVEAFHFSRQNDPERASVHLRVLVDEDAVPAVEGEFETGLDHGSITSVEPEEFEGHVDRWGETAWPIVYEHREHASKTALRILNARAEGELPSADQMEYVPPVVSGNDVTDPLLERHLHLFANQLGYTRREEAEFCQVQALAKGLSPEESRKFVERLVTGN